MPAAVLTVAIFGSVVCSLVISFLVTLTGMYFQSPADRDFLPAVSHSY